MKNMRPTSVSMCARGFRQPPDHEHGNAERLGRAARREKLEKHAILKPNVILVSRQLSLTKACEFQVFTPPKFCLSRRGCVAISGDTRTPEIGARIQASGC